MLRHNMVPPRYINYLNVNVNVNVNKEVDETLFDVILLDCHGSCGE